MVSLIEVTIMHPCQYVTMTNDLPPLFIYDVRSLAASTIRVATTFSLSICGAFTYSSTLSDGSSLPPFITFDPVTLKYIIDSTNVLDVLDYSVIMVVALPTYHVLINVPFTISVINTCVETTIIDPVMYYARGDPISNLYLNMAPIYPLNCGPLVDTLLDSATLTTYNPTIFTFDPITLKFSTFTYLYSQ